jgi:hypothetical protein
MGALREFLPFGADDDPPKHVLGILPVIKKHRRWIIFDELPRTERCASFLLILF